MQFFNLCVTTSALFAALSVAQSITGITGADCNNFVILPKAINSAALAALRHLNAGTTVGRNNYPHRYNNLEGFTFNAGCKPPYYEFPVFTDRVYIGGSPGLDRVVVGSWNGTNAMYCDAITHSGASRNNFNLCDNT
ncbi:Ribonuclease/ribotoxin [Terfezia claveryi]|nr:Ribonuclease/ribotoxin [Terfezia claveryi]